ncbi:MAG: hypothetical protein JWQ74_2244 [Marmoricola sp.]|nr:hypothetical protein [Marmoricola sp.]
MHTSTRHVLSAVVLVTALVGLAGCGGSDSSTASPGPTGPTGPTGSPGATGSTGSPASSGSSGSGAAAAAKSACEITSAATVQKVFGGTVPAGVPGQARNCEFKVAGGSPATVEVFAFGSAADFDSLKSGYADNRGPLQELPGIGESAFSPGDAGQNEVVVKAGGTVFAVSVVALSKKVDPRVKALASAIADELG